MSTHSEKVHKLAKNRAEYQSKRPYTAEKFLQFSGSRDDVAFIASLGDVSTPFKYKAVGMTYHVVSDEQVNGDVDSYVLKNIIVNDDDDDDGDDDRKENNDEKSYLAVNFVTEGQLKKANLDELFPNFELSKQKSFFKATKFTAKSDQMSLLMNPKTNQPTLLVGLGDVIDGYSNSADELMGIQAYGEAINTVTKHIKENLNFSTIKLTLPELHLTRKTKYGYGAGNGIPEKDAYDGLDKTDDEKAKEKKDKENKPVVQIVMPTGDDIVTLNDMINMTIRATTGANHISNRHINSETAAEKGTHIDSLFINVPKKFTQSSQNDQNFTLSDYTSNYNAVNTAESEIFAREVGNEPSNYAFNAQMIKYCELLTQAHPNRLKLKVYDENKLKEMGHNLIVSVGAASTDNPPAIAVLEYTPDNQTGNDVTTKKDKIAIVGKTLTFDTGGLELKPWKYMIDMYYDKLGGVNTLAIMRTLALNHGKQPQNSVIGALAIAENAIGSKATHPSAIISEPNGKTVSVVSPDAEGRLALASAIGLVQNEHNATSIYTMATLTGSVMVGLGNYAAGVFTNDNNKAQDVIKMGLKNGEKYWQMPVFQQHFKNIKGPYSDLQNCNLSSLSDASNAAAFLSNFLNKGSSLVHLDIAGVASLDDGDGMMPKGATGFGVHSVYEHVVSQNPTKKF